MTKSNEKRGVGMSNTSKLLASVGLGALGVFAGTAATVNEADALVTPDNRTPAQAVDTTNTRPYWVGLGIRNEGGNSGGTCTGLLINPRTVLFAAHCVDGLAPAAYDSPTAVGNRAAVGYTTDPLFGRANLRNWLFSQDFGPQPGADGRTMNDSVFVWYDPRSRFGSAAVPNNGTFLPADVAIAGFATPTELLGRDARDGLGLLFSPVTSLVPVTIGGYGESGNGQTGVRTSNATPESYFRRLGQNMLGFLGDERSIALGVYPTAIADLLESPSQVYQDLYWIDFDDPARATRPFFNGPGSDPLCVSTNLNCRLDHDVFPGDAVANESITGAGDSGSPLVTNAFTLNGAAREVSLGVLSQGSRYFYESLGNPNDNLVRFTGFSNYGTAGGWNPLFLFWDQIVVNNPYKYVTAAGGTREWTDASTWTQEIDPLYFTLSGTTLVNGLPTTPALGVSSATPNVGTVRPNPSPPATCAFTGTCPPTGGTGDPVVDGGEVNAALPGRIDRDGMTYSETLDGSRPTQVTPGMEGVITGVAASTTSTDSLMAGVSANTTSNDATLEGVAHSAVAVNDAPPAAPSETMTTALWSSGTLIGVNTGALTGPGTTNFVPNNTVGTAGLQNSTRWFEVNLRSAGTLNLTGATVTIDRLNVRGTGSNLNIRSGATLNTTISSFVDAGGLNVDGVFAPRALNVLGGTVTGSGTINTLAGIGVVGGTITPGAVGGVGTLTVTGGLGVGQAGVMGIDIASATSFDRFAITGPLTINGGGLAVNLLGTYRPSFGTSWTVATSSGPATGSFTTVGGTAFGLLFPNATVSGNNLIVRMDAVNLNTIVDPLSRSQVGIGAALETIRRGSSFAGMSDFFAALDVLSPADARRFLESAAPNDRFAGGQLVEVASMTLRDVLGDRSIVRRNAMMAEMQGNPAMRLAMINREITPGQNPLEMLDALNGTQPASMAGDEATAQGFNAFFDLRSVWGDTTPSPTFVKSDLQTTALTAGFDVSGFGGFTFGAAAQATFGDNTFTGNAGKAETDGYQGAVYLNFTDEGAPLLDVYLSAGKSDIDTTRNVATFTFKGKTDAKTLGAGVSLAWVSDMFGIGFMPKVALDSMAIETKGYTETGGSGALVVPENKANTTLGTLSGTWFAELGGEDDGFKLFPRLSLASVHRLDGDAERFVNTRFAAAPTVTIAQLTGTARDSHWWDVTAGVDLKVSESMLLSFGVNTELNRDSISPTTAQAALRISW